MRFLLEDYKTYYMPNYTKSYWKRHNPDIKMGIVDIKELIDKNNMLSDNSILSRRTSTWGDDYTKYKFKDYIAEFDSDYPIRVRESDLRVLDGNHRIIALYNEGYEKVEVILQ